jgi:hypothetical protein
MVDQSSGFTGKPTVMLNKIAAKVNGKTLPAAT